MQFFKYEGLALCEAWSQENDSRRAMHEKTRKIALKSDAFNQKLQRKSYFFVTDEMCIRDSCYAGTEFFGKWNTGRANGDYALLD